MSEVFIAKPGVLRAVDKTALRKAGIVVVEADFDDVKFIRANVELDSSDMLNAALDALNFKPGTGFTSAAEQREQFMRLLGAALTRKRETPP